MFEPQSPSSAQTRIFVSPFERLSTETISFASDFCKILASTNTKNTNKYKYKHLAEIQNE